MGCKYGKTIKYLENSNLLDTASLKNWATEMFVVKLLNFLRLKWVVLFFLSRCTAWWPLPVLWFFTVRERTKWNKSRLERCPSPHRHTFQARSEVTYFVFDFKIYIAEVFSEVQQFRSTNLLCRLLEEGKLAEADKKKDEVEEKQRERRKEMAKRGEEHIPRFFRWEKIQFIITH